MSSYNNLQLAELWNWRNKNYTWRNNNHKIMRERRGNMHNSKNRTQYFAKHNYISTMNKCSKKALRQYLMHNMK